MEALLNFSPQQAVTSPLSLPTLSYSTTSTPWNLVLLDASRVASPHLKPHDSDGLEKTSPVILGAESSSLPHANFQQVAHHMAADCIASSNQPLDLPFWTPLRTSESDVGSPPVSSEPEDNELQAEVSQVDARSSQAFSTATTLERASGASKPTSSSSLDAKTRTAKKARFIGVVIVSKPPISRKSTPGVQPAQTPRPASSATSLSLVDALRRTFDANIHCESPPPRQARVSLDQDGDASTEDDRPKLNNRLFARRRAAASASEDTTPVPQAVTQRQPRPLKAISYEANSAQIDAALGTAVAPVTLEAELEFDLGDVHHVGQWESANEISNEVDVGGRDAIVTANGFVIPQANVENERSTPMLRVLRKVEPSAVLTPYLSRDAKFRQRLNLMFGEDATVRGDRGARPRLAAHDLFFTRVDEEYGLIASESTTPASHSADSPVIDPDSNTELTSQSPDLQVVDSFAVPKVSGKRQISQTLEQNEGGPMVKKPKVEISEEQMSAWIAALQRLVKGKVRVKEEDLETMSIILAEVQSAKDSLNAGGPMISELREGLKQLSELDDIPFGDRNHLRWQAEKIVLTWPCPV
ncbi:hypothetical protein PAXRUDRAFT_828017 [Paxillus rubicundulus Ve08.2h10]|uniref:Unplaced genomic scaffold scaffold_287, whole genome shotgun sequence n=1 Tax=Paxillus rubicundulus Ve08.2h10 TaxID=930991 RepID=A0A0D0E7X8_9AGAM|nr:hypothetical protein PAXRUDRAFT_828017 [Paxillus rubicundulus Ve08.2h10]